MNYWKVKAAQLELEALTSSARMALSEAQARRDAVFVAEGLDPRAPYTFRDADETIEEPKAPDAVPPA